MLISVSEELQGTFVEQLLCARAHAGAIGMDSILLEASGFVLYSHPGCGQSGVVRFTT